LTDGQAGAEVSGVEDYGAGGTRTSDSQF